MLRYRTRPAGEASRGISRQLQSSRLAWGLAAACLAGLAGCHHNTGPSLEETNYQSYAICSKVVGKPGKPTKIVHQGDMKNPPIGEKSYQLYRKLELGMTPDQVVKIAGPPQQNMPGAVQGAYSYQSDGRVDVIFVDGKADGIVAVGPGQSFPTWAYRTKND